MSSSSEADDPTYPLSHLAISEDLVASQATQQSQIITLDFNGLLNPPLKLQTDVSECGGQLWPAGTVLAEYLLRNQMEELRGKTMFVRSEVLLTPQPVYSARHLSLTSVVSAELNSAPAAVSLALALGLSRTTNIANTIHLTDGLPSLLPLLHTNIALNKTEISPRSLILPSLLPWGTTPLPPSIPTHPDVLLAADCAYFEPAFPKLLDTMRALIGEETVCWFCFKRRRRGDGGMVRLVERERGWCVRKVGGSWEGDGVGLWCIRRKGEREEEGK